jgi:hypothetical protein
LWHRLLGLVSASTCKSVLAHTTSSNVWAALAPCIPRHPVTHSLHNHARMSVMRATDTVHLTEHGMLYVSGHGPNTLSGGWVVGKIGEDMTVEEGRKAARMTAMALLATVESALGERMCSVCVQHLCICTHRTGGVFSLPCSVHVCLLATVESALGERMCSL